MTLTRYDVTRSCRQPWAGPLTRQCHERLYFTQHGHSRQLHRVNVLCHVARYSCHILHHGLVNQYNRTGEGFRACVTPNSLHDTDRKRDTV